MQPTNTKKRRLEALSKQLGQNKGPSPPAQQLGGAKPDATGRVPAAAAVPADAARSRSNSQAPPAAGAAEQDGPAKYPYLPLPSSQPTAHIASRLQLPAPAACRGNLEDALERLMLPHMPMPVAQSMIATRTAADKAVVLVNPTGRINLAKPSSSSRAQRPRLSDKLLQRAQRTQLAALPRSGIDYGAMLALHELWCKYAGGVLENASPELFAGVLNALDWHGALVRVVASKNPIYLHRVGIVAKATHTTFVLVSDDGRSSTVPLRGSSFECTLDCGRVVHVTLAGDNLKALKCTEKVD